MGLRDLGDPICTASEGHGMKEEARNMYLTTNMNRPYHSLYANNHDMQLLPNDTR